MPKHKNHQKYSEKKLIRYYSRNDLTIIPKQVLEKTLYQYDADSKDYLKAERGDNLSKEGLLIACKVPNFREMNNILFTRSAFISLLWTAFEDDFEIDLPFLDKEFEVNYKQGRGFVFNLADE